jgi:hypothetical protein
MMMLMLLLTELVLLKTLLQEEAMSIIFTHSNISILLFDVPPNRRRTSALCRKCA